MTIELPSGFGARPATPADGDAILQLIAASELADDGAVEVDAADMTVGFGRHGFDPALDSILVFDGDEPVAWAELYRWRGEATVRPSHRGKGIGAGLLGWMEARGRALGNASVGQTKTDADAAARELFLAKGFVPTWTSWMIRIGLEERPAPASPPPGISIRPYVAADAVEVHRVVDAAFSEWDGRDPEPFDVWASEMIAHPAFRPDLSPLAFDGDELVGVVMALDFPELAEGWIQQLATKGTHRRRGIAQALLLTSFGWFHEAGRRIAGVATDSRTGALGLYEKVGMRVVRQYTKYVKRLG